MRENPPILPAIPWRVAMLERRKWVPAASENYVQVMAERTAQLDGAGDVQKSDRPVKANRRIHDLECINLTPATNVMNPKAEALLSVGLGSRPSLGYPGNKYEMGLEAIEQIEVIAAELAAEVFDARFAEIRVPSGAIANLYMYVATSKPGDAVIVPPADIGGHITRHAAGAAGIYPGKTHFAPAAAAGYSLDVDPMRGPSHALRPQPITIG